MAPARRADVNQFLARRADGWRRLEILLERVESSSLQQLTSDEVREFGQLYRRASSDLVTARSKTANAEVLEYLNDLVARAYAQVYRTRRFHLRTVLVFLTVDFPRLVRHSWKYVGLAAAIMVVCGVFGWEINRRDPAGAYYMLPPSMVRQFPAMRDRWRGATGHTLSPDQMAGLSSFIMTHNIAIGFFSFVGGIFLGLPTLYVMVQTGTMVGILGQSMSHPDTALVFWSLILPHGILELFAICVMGGAGFLLASGLLAPGDRRRIDALIERGRYAVLLALGGMALLVLAGIIEGFITPPAWIPPIVKLLFAGLTAVGLVLYFGLAGRGPEPGLLKELAAYEEPGAELARL